MRDLIGRRCTQPKQQRRGRRQKWRQTVFDAGPHVRGRSGSRSSGARTNDRA